MLQLSNFGGVTDIFEFEFQGMFKMKTNLHFNT